MAYALDVNKFPPEYIEHMKNLLVMKSAQKYDAYGTQEQSVVHLYIQQHNILHLPYLWASSMLKIIPNVDIEYPPSPLNFTGSLRDNQKPVASQAQEQLQLRGTTTLGLHPGFGKTIVGAYLASTLKLITVVLVHREILTTQWKKTFNDNTDAVVWIVGQKMPNNPNVIICMVTRWHKISDSLRDQVGCMIIDEAHALCTPSAVPCLMSFHPIYIIAETATLYREDGLHSVMYAICGSHGIFIDTSKPFNITMVKTGIQPIEKMTRFKKLDYHKLTDSIATNEQRNNIILETVKSNTHFKILILTALKDHATTLFQNIKQEGISCDYLCGTKKGYSDSTVLVGTTSKIGTGFDPATSCPTYDNRPFDLLLLVCSIKKYSMLVQNVGRIFRADHPTIFHFVDDHRIYENHWNICKRWYRKHGGVIVEYDVNTSTYSETPSLASSVSKSKKKSNININTDSNKCKNLASSVLKSYNAKQNNSKTQKSSHPKPPSPIQTSLQPIPHTSLLHPAQSTIPPQPPIQPSNQLYMSTPQYHIPSHLQIPIPQSPIPQSPIPQSPIPQSPIPQSPIPQSPIPPQPKILPSEHPSISISRPLPRLSMPTPHPSLQSIYKSQPSLQSSPYIPQSNTKSNTKSLPPHIPQSNVKSLPPHIPQSNAKSKIKQIVESS